MHVHEVFVSTGGLQVTPQYLKKMLVHNVFNHNELFSYLYRYVTSNNIPCPTMLIQSPTYTSILSAIIYKCAVYFQFFIEMYQKAL